MCSYVLIKIKLILPVLFISFYLVSCSSVARFTSNKETDERKIENADKQNEELQFYRNAKILKTIRGIASYYGNKYNGHVTANGEVYDMYSMTAANNELPFNTIVRVTNIENGKEVILRINDRGPFIKDRLIDVSYEAARKLGMITNGTAEVKVDILKWGNSR